MKKAFKNNATFMTPQNERHNNSEFLLSFQAKPSIQKVFSEKEKVRL
jgi:hypothetical protein